MRVVTHLLVPAALGLTASIAAGQGRPVVELGTHAGVTILNNGGSITQFRIPGQGILGQPTIYGSILLGSGLLVEPQIALNILSSEGETATTVGLAGQVGYAFSGHTMNSPFIFGTGAFQSVSGGGFSDSEFGAGAGVGYRLVIGQHFSVRFDGHFRRWFDSEVNEFAAGVGFGGVLWSSR